MLHRKTKPTSTIVSYAALFFLCCFFMVQGIYCPPAQAKEASSILVIHSHYVDHGRTKDIQRGIEDAITQKNNHGIQPYIEYLDTRRFDFFNYRSTFVEYVKKKYHAANIDGIILNGNAAYELYISELYRFFPDKPVFFLDVSTHSHSRAKDYPLSGLETNQPIDEMIDFMIKYQKEIKSLQVYAVPGIQPEEERILLQLRSNQALKEAQIDLNIQTINDMDSLLFEVSKLDRTDAVYVPIGSLEGGGIFIDSTAVLTELASLGQAPIYHTHAHLLGEGIIGGPLSDGQAMGYLGALTLMEYFDQKNFPPPEKAPLTYAYDYRFLKEYGLAIPAAGSGYSFIDSSNQLLIGQNVVIVFGGIGLFLLLFLLIGMLIHAERQTQSGLKEASFRAQHDLLTMLANRATLNHDLKCYQNSYIEGNINTLSIFFMDIDHFKDVNDTYGHGAGDAVLRTVAQRLQDLGSPGRKKVYRYAGDEFVMVITGLSPKDQASLGKQVMTVFDPPHQAGGKDIPISLSIGVASMPTDTDQVKECLDMADQAMYVAKQEGRKQVHFYSPKDPGRSLAR